MKTTDNTLISPLTRMSDRLTQLQVCIDQLMTQFYSAINHVNKHHDFVPLGNEDKASDPAMEVLSSDQFERDMEELARDLVTKSKQINTLIDSLPGAGIGEEEQLQRVAELQLELEAANEEHQQAIKEQNELLKKCDDLILRVTKEKVTVDLGQGH